MTGNLDTVKFILGKGMDPYVSDNKDRIPIMLAAENGNTETVNFLTMREKNLETAIANDFFDIFVHQF